MNYYYRNTIPNFLKASVDEIIGTMTRSNEFDATFLQNKSWELQIPILKKALNIFNGEVFFEFSIPRMGKRVDTLVIIKNVVFVIEFKVGEKHFLNHNVEQVWDYALDLKNFHKTSHSVVIIPVLIATEAKKSFTEIQLTSHNDNLTLPVKIGSDGLFEVIQNALNFFSDELQIDIPEYVKGGYMPTPTIIEAAVSLYTTHSVKNITRSDADAKNLTVTTSKISEIIESAQSNNNKIICFVTGVPGAGKTLVGLNVATTHLDNENGNASVYLSGNKPLVDILQEALARDKVQREKGKGNKLTKKAAKQAVKAFIQIIHHYRDEYLKNSEAPYDHVAIFDEAQRAWNKEQTVKFMKQKKGISDFDYSEPEFLISCLNRHKDWAVIVCLVGGGQEINTGEAGISEWLDAIDKTFPDWNVYISQNLTDSEYMAIDAIEKLKSQGRVSFDENLHLSVSMRSFRAEKLSSFVKNLLDLNIEKAKDDFLQFCKKYPIVLTRDIVKAKKWLKEKARGSERYGIVVSSQALRLKPFAIDVRSPLNYVNWFLDDKDDVRSSFYLEDVVTEFHIQGLELDWSCIVWDGDLRYSENSWQTFSFRGKRWQNINKIERKKYLLNAYRVLLTRARQGMVIVIPEGNEEDHTRKKEYYDPTFNYLRNIGIQTI
jgi:adenylylsulfate kinase-like enzyme